LSRSAASRSPLTGQTHSAWSLTDALRKILYWAIVTLLDDNANHRTSV
jgi:hypothetical protein